MANKVIKVEMTLVKALKALANKEISHEDKMSLIDIMSQLAQDEFRNGIKAAENIHRRINESSIYPHTTNESN